MNYSRLCILIAVLVAAGGAGIQAESDTCAADQRSERASGLRYVFRKPVPELIALLGDSDMVIRQAAALELGERADASAISALKIALDDSELAIRIAAARSLGRLGDQSGLPVLKEALRSGDKIWSLKAAKCLAENGDDAGRPLLEEILSDPQPLYRREALCGLACLPGALSVDALRAGMDDPHEMLRFSAFRIAGEQTDPEFVSLLRGYLRADEPAVRRLAIGALSGSGVKENIPWVIDMLTDPDLLLRDHALRCLELATGRKTGMRKFRTLEGAAATRQDWAQWWEENKDKPLPHAPAPAEEAPPAP